MLRFVFVLACMVVVAFAFVPNPLCAQAPVTQRAADDLGIRWIEVEAGTFTMGTGNAALQVTIERFFMSATEVTFDQYDAFCDATGKRKPDDNGWGRGTRPVINVSYDDAVEYARWLSEETGSAIRLPNEAEWEYAAQGGPNSRGYDHSGGDNKNDVSWNEDNSDNQTHPVGTRQPNELGLFDMSGNLWEWCADWPEGSCDGAECALRGDSYDNPGDSIGLRLSLRLERDSRHTNIGFRVARSE